jgi:hypothetical protein
MAQQIPPPAPGMSPQEYYSFLNSKGIPSWQAYDATTAAYGQPRNPNEPPPPPSQANQWGQVAGTVGGAMIGSEIVGGFPTIGGLFKSGGAEVAKEVGKEVGTEVGKEVATEVGKEVATDVATEAAATPAGEGLASSLGTYALPAAIAAWQLNNVWEGGMKDIVRGKADKADWTNQAVNMNPYTAPINMGLRLFGKRSVGEMMRTGKSDAQQLRDDFRGELKASGIADENYNVTLADGSKYNIGIDGKARLQNVGKNIDGKETRQHWDVDFSNPLAKYATSKLDPIIRAKYGPEAEQAGYKPEQFTGMMVNAVTSNAKSEADVDANIRAIYGDSAVGGGAPSAPQQAGMQKLPAPMPQGMTIDQMSGAIANAPSMQSTPPDRSGLSPEQNQMVEDLINRLRNQGR